MKVMVIAEIASNWDGNIAKAKKIIKECKKAGADAVKFQMWRASDLYNSKHPNWNEIKKSEVTFEKAKLFKKFADEEKIEFLSSAFYPDAVTFLEKLNVKKYKIASRTCLFKDPYSYETLISKAKTRKPVIISMGMGGNKQKIKNIFKKIILLSVIAFQNIQLNFTKLIGIMQYDLMVFLIIQLVLLHLLYLQY